MQGVRTCPSAGVSQPSHPGAGVVGRFHRQSLCVCRADVKDAQLTSGRHGAYKLSRRDLLTYAPIAVSVCDCVLSERTATAFSDDFIATPSGLRILDVRLGDGPVPQPGDKIVVHWAGFTKGYQGKRIDNTSIRDEPYEFTLGSHQVGSNKTCMQQQ